MSAHKCWDSKQPPQLSGFLRRCWRSNSNPHIWASGALSTMLSPQLTYGHSSFVEAFSSNPFDSTTCISPKKTSFVLGVMVHTYKSYLKCRNLRILNFRSGLGNTVRLSQTERKERKKKPCNFGENLYSQNLHVNNS